MARGHGYAFERPSGAFWSDRFGAIAGGLCAIHCVATVAATSALSATGLGFLIAESTEHVFFGAALCFIVASAVLGYRAHRSLFVPAAFTVFTGVWLSGTMVADASMEGWLHAIAAAGIGATHLYSLKLVRRRRQVAHAPHHP